MAFSPLYIQKQLERSFLLLNQVGKKIYRFALSKQQQIACNQAHSVTHISSLNKFFFLFKEQELKVNVK